MRTGLRTLSCCLSGVLSGWHGLAWAVDVAGTPIPFRREIASEASDMSRYGGAMLICLILLALVLYLLRRHLMRQLQGKPQETHLQILQTQALGAHAKLHVVRFGQRRLLLSSSAQGVVSVVCEEAVTEHETPMGDETPPISPEPSHAQS